MTRTGSDWPARRAEAEALGEVTLFGEGGVTDTLPDRGRSVLGPALTAAAAGNRPVIVVTDGELDDARDLPPDLLSTIEVRPTPRHQGPAAAVRGVDGPARVSLRDTVALRVEVVTAALTAPGVAVELRADQEVLDQAVASLGEDGRGSVILRTPAARLGAGDRALRVALAEPVDSEERDDARWHLVTVSEAPGFVVVTTAPDWDARFLYNTLRGVTSLPVEGYAMVRPGSWRRMSDQSAVEESRVRTAFGTADVVVNHGGPLSGWRTTARGILSWEGEPGAGTGESGDWYLEPGGLSPVSGVLGLFALDSLAPGTALAATAAGPPADWTALTARRDRRGTPRVALTGRETGLSREVQVHVAGLWRWAFRGGRGEQAYRALMAGLADWLVGGHPDTEDLVRPVRALVSQGEPLVFITPPPPSGTREPVAITLTSEQGGPEITDTLRFDGEGVAALRLPPGLYNFAAGSSRGLVGVDTWSEEWFPGPVTLEGRSTTMGQAFRRGPVRDRPWLFGLTVAAFCTEWWLRRRRGLR